LNNIVILKSRLAVTQPANLCTICTLLKSANNFFADDSMRFSRFYTASPGKVIGYKLRRCVTVVQDQSSSLKLVPIEIAYATSYWFSIVNMPIFYCFRDITIYWLKISVPIYASYAISLLLAAGAYRVVTLCAQLTRDL